MDIDFRIDSRGANFRQILESANPFASIDEHGNTILHVIGGEKDESWIDWILSHVVRLHLEAGFSIQNSSGWTPFQMATQFGLSSTLEKFFHLSPTELDVADSLGNTPLHFAIMIGGTEKVELLTRLGSRSLTWPNWFRRTPLMMLADWDISRVSSESHLQVLNLFQSGGTNGIDLANLSGQTALEIALHRRNRKLVQVLRAVGMNSTSISELMTEPISIDDIIAVRFTVYFERSLVSILSRFL